MEEAKVGINSVNITTDTEGVATIKLFEAAYPFTETATGFGDYSNQVIGNGVDVSVNVLLIGMSNVAANLCIYPNPTTRGLNVMANGMNNFVVLNTIKQVVHTETLNGNATIDPSNHASRCTPFDFNQETMLLLKRTILE